MCPPPPNLEATSFTVNLPFDLKLTLNVPSSCSVIKNEISTFNSS